MKLWHRNFLRIIAQCLHILWKFSKFSPLVCAFLQWNIVLPVIMLFTWNKYFAILRTLNFTYQSLGRRVRYILSIFLYFRLKLCKNIKKTTALRIVIFWGIYDEGIAEYMIKILNIQTCVRSQHVMQSASARYIFTHERFRLILFALYYFRMKLCQNVEKTTAIHWV